MIDFPPVGGMTPLYNQARMTKFERVMNKQPARLPEKKNVPKKKKASVPSPARATVPQWVGGPRSPQPVNGPQTSMEDETEFESYRHTPFGETEQREDGEPSISGPAAYVQEGEEPSALYKFLKPEQSELDAERNGQRWHWALQHRWMPPGSQWNETVWNGVDRETRDNQFLQKMLAQRETTPLASARTHSTMMNQWRQFIRDVQKGHFDSYGGTSESAQRWATNFKQKFDEMFGDDASEALSPMPEVLGERKALASKTNTDYRALMTDALRYGTELENALDGGNLDHIKAISDKVSTNFLARLGGDGAGMADAEKKRLQFVTLSDTNRQIVNNVTRDYLDACVAIARKAGESRYTSDVYTKVRTAQEALKNKDDAGLAGAVAGLGGLFISPLAKESGLPTDVVTMLSAAKQEYDTFMDQLMYAAEISPQVAYNVTRYVYENTKQKYNNEMDAIGRPNDKWELAFPEIPDDVIKQNDAKVSEMLRKLAPDFYKPSLVKRPTGGNVSTNPNSRGELNPVPDRNLNQEKMKKLNQVLGYDNGTK